MKAESIFATLVFEGGLSPIYVADEAEMYELNILMRNIYLRYKDSWERTRMLSYVTAQVNSSKRIKPLDLMHFMWDDEAIKSDMHISTDEIERLKKKAQKYIKNGCRLINENNS